MLKSLVSRYPLIILSCSFINLSYAYSEPNDPLQAYRDEIKQSETNASQAVLDALQSNATDVSTQQNQVSTESSISTPTPRSNYDKAFTPSDNKPENTTQPLNKNPWLKPNPWAKQPPNIWEKNAKVNPYSNAPIPGPTPSTNLTTPSPPNIFSPSRQILNSNKSQANADH